MSKDPEMGHDSQGSSFWANGSSDSPSSAPASIGNTSDYNIPMIEDDEESFDNPYVNATDDEGSFDYVEDEVGSFEYVDNEEGSFEYNEDADMAAEDINRYYDVQRYQQAKRKSHKGVIIAVVVVLFIIVGGAIAAGIYISNINARLGEKVTEDLRDQLVQTEPGDPFYLLLLGVDKDQSRVEDTEQYGADESNYRSDSIMLCRIDPKSTKVTMVSIHRDTLIKMDEHGQQKINAAYSFGGPPYATKIVSEFAGVPISHYAEVDLDRFIDIVEQVGGVTVNLPVPVYDPEYTGLDLPAGEQTLDGETAALLCRCRHGYDNYGDGDVFRAANQRMVFSAVIKKVLKSDPATIAGTVAAMADSVTTDMDVAAILDLASQMQNLNVDTDISTGMEPTDGALINGTWYEICLVDDWRKMMMRVDRGESPYDESAGEHDTTAGIAGSVGQEGERAAEAAVEADRQEAIAQESTEDYSTEE